MSPWLLDVLACPAYRARLAPDGDVLRCIRAGHRYPVIKGIPRFLDAAADRATAAAFGYEFRVLDPQADERIRADDAGFFFQATGYPPAAPPVRGNLVLDAGCGCGRFTRPLANAGACVVVALVRRGGLHRHSDPADAGRRAWQPARRCVS